MKLFFILIFCSLISFASVSQAPEYTATVYDSSATTGYYFMAGGLYKLILDRYGNIIYYEHGKPSSNFELHSNGMMSYANLGNFFLMDSTFTIVDSIKCKNNIKIDVHDMRFLSNGHLLLLGSEIATMDLSDFCWRGGYDSVAARVRACVVQELDSSRNVVFEWHAKDYLAFADIDTFHFSGGSPIDWTHSNSLDMDNDGNILLSNRNFNEITKINHSDGSVMWRFGGKNNQFKIINCPVPFYGQHNIRRMGNGHISFFDGGNHPVHHAARALEFELDEKNKIATLVWTYVRDTSMYSTAQGSVQRLANFNTVVDYGEVLGKNITFVVVDSCGSKILEVDGQGSYKTINYTTLPWQLHRPQISCFDSSGIAWLDAGAGYSDYCWSNGLSDRIIPVTAVDTYYVFVPYGPSGYISSEKLIVSDKYNPCRKPLCIISNGSEDNRTVAYYLSENTDVNISIWDVGGRKITDLMNGRQEGGDHSFAFDVSKLDAGFYFVKLNEHAAEFIK